MLRLACLVSLVVGTGACTLNLGGDDTPGDDTCNYNAPEAPGAPLDLLNPETLQCQTFAGGGGTYCPPNCPCPVDTTTDAVPIPTWGWCTSPCNGLAEDVCLAAAECRAVYDYACYTGDGPCTAEVPYLGCYPTDQSGPVTGGSCVGLDSWTCSLHNDCIALHTPQCSGDTRDCWEQFVSCDAEPAPSCGPAGCG